MDDDPMEGTSELFASVLSDVSAEEWENYKQLNKYGNYIVDSASDDDSCMSDRSVSPYSEEMIANVELVEDEEADEVASEVSDDEENDSGQTAWGCDAAVKYVNGEITFSELNDIMENKKPKDHPRKRRRTEKEPKEPRQESQIEKEHREYEMELKNKRKKGRRKMSHLPKELEGLMGAAHVKFAQGETEDAIKMCMELIRLAPTAQEPFQTLGVIYDAIGEPRKSLQCYLVAACLDPSDTEEWIRLADLSLEQNKIAQAISCYSYAIRNEPDNVPFLWERCNLYERVGDRKKALAGYEQILKHLSAPEAGQKCVEMSREIAKVHYENTDYINAIKVLEMAFTKFPSLITSEDVNFLLELQLNQKFYKSAIKNFVQHCGVKLQMPDREIDAPDELECFTDDDFKVVLNCYVPEVLPVDLAVKVLLCLINLQSLTAVQPLLEALIQENPEDFGDLYLDVAEAFMEIKEYEFGKILLSKLLKTANYNLPAVWMKYADCLCALSHIEEAMTAYRKVIEMAPTYQEARLALSNILLNKGKIAEAAGILKQEYEEGKEVTTLGIDALYQRCRLLQAEKRWDEFIQAAILLQYSHCYLLETEEEFSAVLANQTSKRRNEALRDLKAQSKKAAPEFIGSKICVSDMWDIFKLVSNKLMEQKRFEELQSLSLAALTSTMFMKNTEMSKDCEFQALLSCFFNSNHYYSYVLVKDLVIKNINNPKAWNLFCLIITRSQESRHNRFCLRLMMKHQDHLALGFLNGHNAMISGTYKHALGEYMCILKERPNDPFATFCVGYTFIHMACQKFATKRHFLALQGFVFLTHYLKLKGECQEACYNIGRALHQLGMKDMAIQYYKKALCASVVIKGPDEEVFNLKREIAYNLSLIYQATGAFDLAYMYSRKYIVV